ncbi:MAG: heparan-alpha-glucosaminide N-acetyltransferase [Rhodoferax sp.]
MQAQRVDAVDALRGLAMVWMTVFHFCFDLSQQGLLRANFYADPFWTTQRTCILSLFLACAGMGQSLALANGQRWARFARRATQIGLCALAVTAASMWMFPNSFIYFGVLHGMLVMLLLVRLAAPLGGWLWPLGALLLALKPLAAWAIGIGWWSAVLNTRALNWLGLVSVKPITEDFVPLVPWLGVMCWAMAAMQWWLHRAPRTTVLPRWLAPAAALGRWSLTYYMLHQPVLLGLLWLWTTGRGG